MSAASTEQHVMLYWSVTFPRARTIMLELNLQIFQSKISLCCRYASIITSDRLLRKSNTCEKVQKTRRPSPLMRVSLLLLEKDVSVAFADFSLPLPSLKFAFYTQQTRMNAAWPQQQLLVYTDGRSSQQSPLPSLSSSSTPSCCLVAILPLLDHVVDLQDFQG